MWYSSQSVTAKSGKWKFVLESFNLKNMQTLKTKYDLCDDNKAQSRVFFNLFLTDHRHTNVLEQNILSY